MLRTCKGSYLLIYITSGSYVNKLNVRYLVEILALQIAAKQLQLATWLLLTAYRNLPTPYPTVPSPILYDVPFSHNTNDTDRRQTDRTSYHERDRTTQYGRLKTVVINRQKFLSTAYQKQVFHSVRPLHFKKGEEHVLVCACPRHIAPVAPSSDSMQVVQRCDTSGSID